MGADFVYFAGELGELGQLSGQPVPVALRQPEVTAIADDLGLPARLAGKMSEDLLVDGLGGGVVAQLDEDIEGQVATDEGALFLVAQFAGQGGGLGVDAAGGAEVGQLGERPGQQAQGAQTIAAGAMGVVENGLQAGEERFVRAGAILADPDQLQLGAHRKAGPARAQGKLASTLSVLPTLHLKSIYEVHVTGGT